jgi:hypothetical protein
MKHLLAQLTSEHITSLIGLATLVVNMVLIPLVVYVISRQKKSETTILDAGSKREERLTAKVDESTNASKSAIDAANGLTVKHTETVAVAKEAVDVAKLALERTGTQQVEVVNPPDHPIPTKPV